MIKLQPENHSRSCITTTCVRKCGGDGEKKKNRVNTLKDDIKVGKLAWINLDFDF